MSDAEHRFLRRFLAQPKPGPPPTSAAARQSRQDAARLAADQFAREAVAALHLLEQSVPDSERDPASLVGRRFGQSWDLAGLRELDWTDADRSDAQKILAAAAELAKPAQTIDDGWGRVTLDDAWMLAVNKWVHDKDEDNGRPVVETPESIRTDLEGAYDTSSGSREPAKWLRQSLGRLSKARVLEDLVRRDTTVRVPEETTRLAQNLVEQVLRLEGDRAEVKRAAASVGRASERNMRSMIQAVAYWTAIGVGTVAALPVSVRAVLMGPGVYLAARAFRAEDAHGSAQETFNSQVRQLTGTRDAVADTLDRVTAPPPGQLPPGGRPGLLDRFRRDGGGQRR